MQQEFVFFNENFYHGSNGAMFFSDYAKLSLHQFSAPRPGAGANMMSGQPGVRSSPLGGLGRPSSSEVPVIREVRKHFLLECGERKTSCKWFQLMTKKSLFEQYFLK